MEHKKFEEVERICSWREMAPGYWYYIGVEVRGMNKWNKPIAVVTMKLELGGPSIKLYAPSSLYYGLRDRPNTSAILYEGEVQRPSGNFYPKFKYAD